VWKNIPKTNIGDGLNQWPNTNVLRMPTMHDQGSTLQSVSGREGRKGQSLECGTEEADGRARRRSEVRAFLWVSKQASEEHAFS